jgi:hypothetical protein
MCGGSNPVDDLFSSAGDALADLDDTVAETIPGGWMTAARLAMMANGVPADVGYVSDAEQIAAMNAAGGAADTVGYVSDAQQAAEMANARDATSLSDLTQTPTPTPLPGDVSQGSNFPGETDDYGNPLNRGPSEGPVTSRGYNNAEGGITSSTIPPENNDFLRNMSAENELAGPGVSGAQGGSYDRPFSLSDLGNSALGGVKSVGNWAMKNPIPAMYAGGSLYDMYAKNKMAKKQEGIYNQNRADIMNAYAPGSPEYEQMAQAMARKDAAAGRNSQYGTRANDLAATLAKMRMNSLTSLQGSQNTLANQSMSNQYGMFNTPLALAMYSQRPRSRATPIEDTSY